MQTHPRPKINGNPTEKIDKIQLPILPQTILIRTRRHLPLPGARTTVPRLHAALQIHRRQRTPVGTAGPQPVLPAAGRSQPHPRQPAAALRYQCQKHSGQRQNGVEAGQHGFGVQSGRDIPGVHWGLASLAVGVVEGQGDQ